MIRRYFIDRKAHRAVERECRLVGFEDCEHDFLHSPRRADVGKLLRKQFPKTAMPGALGNLKFVTVNDILMFLPVEAKHGVCNDVRRVKSWGILLISDYETGPRVEHFLLLGSWSPPKR